MERVLMLFFVSFTSLAFAWSVRRRQVLSAGTCALLFPSAASSAEQLGLAARLAKKDPALLDNHLFNLSPPIEQIYPHWLRGDFTVSSNFAGFLFPSKIPKDRLLQNTVVPGFQKCSIATTADVGKEGVSYQWKVDEPSGMEDKPYNIASQINSYLGYRAVKEVLYKPSNPNRISVDFVDYRTVNAERIELFCNARESESYTRNDTPIFVCSEYYRQVTFGTGSTVGVPRQVSSNYANFWTFVQTATGFNGNLLTTAYLDPQDPMYFEESKLPVAVYSHSLMATRQG